MVGTKDLVFLLLPILVCDDPLGSVLEIDNNGGEVITDVPEEEDASSSTEREVVYVVVVEDTEGTQDESDVAVLYGRNVTEDLSCGMVTAVLADVSAEEDAAVRRQREGVEFMVVEAEHVDRGAQADAVITDGATLGPS